jgi:hypothetical protein
LLINFLFLSFVLVDLFLTRLQNILDRFSAFFNSFLWELPVLIVFCESTFDRSRSIGDAIYCALHEASHSSDWLRNNADEASTNTFGNSFRTLIHTAFDRLGENSGNTIKCTSQNRISSVTKA